MVAEIKKLGGNAAFVRADVAKRFRISDASDSPSADFATFDQYSLSNCVYLPSPSFCRHKWFVLCDR